MSSNLDNFMTIYEKHLTQCLAEEPDRYAWVGKLTVRIVVDRMRPAIVGGTFDKRSEAFKRTCNELGIKHTYKAIKAFLAVSS